jgi:U3 small nucleolar RNA-associated protein 25
LEYVRIRNHLNKIASDVDQSIDYAALSEYSSASEVARGRYALYHGKVALLMITERFHYYHRLHIRGCTRLYFYAPPMYPRFYAEMVNTLTPEKDDDYQERVAHTTFTRYDALQLERIVGAKHVERLISSEQDTFMFAQ